MKANLLGKRLVIAAACMSMLVCAVPAMAAPEEPQATVTETDTVAAPKTDIVKMTYNGETAWWYTVDGVVAPSANIVAKNSAGWWYVENGKVNFNYNGFGANGYGIWYCKNGKVDFTATGVLKDVSSGQWGYFKNGKLQVGQETVAKNSAGWWYITKGGMVDFTAFTVAKNEYGWWAIENGKVNFNFNGLASNDNGTWYCKNGKVDFSVTGVVKDECSKRWVYVKGGKLQTGAATVQKNSAGWWYIDENGYVDFGIETVAKNENGWWYIKNGKVDFTFTGIGQNKNGDWYCEKGKVNFGYTKDCVAIGNGSYDISGGKVKYGEFSDVDLYLKNMTGYTINELKIEAAVDWAYASNVLAKPWKPNENLGLGEINYNTTVGRYYNVYVKFVDDKGNFAGSATFKNVDLNRSHKDKIEFWIYPEAEYYYLEMRSAYGYETYVVPGEGAKG